MKRSISILAVVSTFIFLVTLSTNAFSQLTGIGSALDVNGNQTRMIVRAGEIIDENAIIKPYLDENYRLGVVTFVGGTTKEGAFRYKVDEELIEFQDEDSFYSYENILKFNWKNTSTGATEDYENLKKIWPRSEYGGLARKINDKVISKAFMDYVAPTRSPSMDMGDPKSYYVVNEYYLALIDNKLIEFPRSKKDFFKVFGKYEKEVKKQASKEKFKHDEDKGVIGIINFYENISKK